MDGQADVQTIELESIKAQDLLAFKAQIESMWLLLIWTVAVLLILC